MAAPGVLQNSRRRIIPQAAKTKGSESPLTFRFNKVGMLAGILLRVSGAVAGTLTSPNPLGMASIVRRIEVLINSGIRLHTFSGAGYHYLIRDFLEDYKDPVPYSNARSAVTATTFDISMYVPVAVNLRDAIGLYLLQNEQTEVVCTVDFEADANVAAGVTSITATVKPSLIVFSTPKEKGDWPDFSVVHSIIEETKSISATGKFQHNPIRGQTYLQLLMGYGIGVSGADSFNSARLQILGSDQVEYYEPAELDLAFAMTHGRSRLKGVIALDWLGTSGLGSYGSARDAVQSRNISDIQVEIDATAQPVTFYAIRRQLIELT